VDAWSIGLIALIVVGLAAIIFGAVWDRRRNKRRAAEMLAPPPRTIPHFTPDAPAPHYLSDLQARRRQVGYASRDFVTDATSGWAVLEHPAVLVCGDPIDTFRELLGPMEKLILSDSPLVVAAPAIARDVLATLEVNTIRQTMRLLAVICDDAGRDTVAAACHAMIIDRSDRQSGYLGPEHLGHCERWISTATSSHVIVAAETKQESL
jgi:hypothetical protein